jgi:hypothetical protein
VADVTQNRVKYVLLQDRPLQPIVNPIKVNIGSHSKFITSCSVNRNNVVNGKRAICRCYCTESLSGSLSNNGDTNKTSVEVKFHMKSPNIIHIQNCLRTGVLQFGGAIFSTCVQNYLSFLSDQHSFIARRTLMLKESINGRLTNTAPHSNASCYENSRHINTAAERVKIPIIRRYLRFSLSEEHLMGPSMSICRVFQHTVTTVTLDHIVTITILDHIVTMTTSDTIIASDTIVALIFPSLPC